MCDNQVIAVCDPAVLHTRYIWLLYCQSVIWNIFQLSKNFLELWFQDIGDPCTVTTVTCVCTFVFACVQSMWLSFPCLLTHYNKCNPIMYLQLEEVLHGFDHPCPPMAWPTLSSQAEQSHWTAPILVAAVMRTL